MKPPAKAVDIPVAARPPLPESFANRLGPYRGRSLGDHFGITQFGARLETLAPGTESALRHWHTKSDELIYVLEGELTLITGDGETVLGAGTCAGFVAGDENAHHLVNRSGQAGRFLAIGTRVAGDEVHYPDDDFRWVCDEAGNWYAARKDGTRYVAVTTGDK